MRKSSVVAFVVGMASMGSVYAATPFAFVPAGHWSYDAVAGLVEQGLLQEYQEVHFQKEQQLTRHDMAVLVAKAMTHEQRAVAPQTEALRKLAAEYRAELSTLGVPYGGPEQGTPGVSKGAAGNVPVAFSGYYRLRYQNQHDDTNSANSYHSLYSRIQLDATAKIGDAWTGNFSWEAYKSFYKDAGQPYGTMASAWGANGYNGVNDLTTANVSGPLGGTTVTVGKFRHVFGSGLMFDDKVSGIRTAFGNTVKTQLVYAEADANIAGNTPINSYLSKLSKVTAVDVSYDLSKATRLTTSLQNWVSKTPGVDDLRVVDVNVTTAINPTVSLYATYDKTSADSENQAYVVGLAYKGADHKQPGSFGAFIDYEYFPQNTAIDTGYSIILTGTKGWAAGFNYVPAKDIKFTTLFAYTQTLAANNLGPQGTAEAEGAKQRFFRTQLFYYF